MWVDPVSLFQLNADAEQNGNTIVPASRNINGIAIKTLLTPLGEVGVYLGEFLPEGTVMLWNPAVVAPVEQPHPEKGNFFLEELAKTGAGAKYQIFGQIGLDHGPEWYHGKISNISTLFEKPKPGKIIYTVDPIEVTEVFPEIEDVEVAASIENDAPTVINVTLDPAVAGLTLDNFALEKNGEAYAGFAVTTGTDPVDYVLTMNDAAAAGDVFVLTITKAGYDFPETQVENNVEA